MENIHIIQLYTPLAVCMCERIQPATDYIGFFPFFFMVGENANAWHVCICKGVGGEGEEFRFDVFLMLKNGLNFSFSCCYCCCLVVG